MILNTSFWYLPGASVDRVVPSFALGSGGSMVTLVGSNLFSGTVTTCLFGLDGIPGTLAILSSSMVHCTVPVHEEGHASISLDVGLGQVSQTLDFEFISEPSLVSIWPSLGWSNGGALTKIFGLDFFSSSVECVFGKLRSEGSRMSSTLALCSTPPSEAGVIPVGLTFEDLHFEAGFGFEFLPNPRLTAVVPCQGSTSSSTLVSVVGSSFFDIPTLQCSISQEMDSKATWISSSVITCVIPTASPGNVTLDLSVEGALITNAALVFEHLDFRALDSISPSVGLDIGGTKVTLTGLSLGDAGRSVRFDGTPAKCERVEVSTVVCIAPPHAPGSVRVTVHQGVIEDDAISFVYTAAPELQRLAPSSGSLGGGTAITAIGVNFLPRSTSCRFEHEMVDPADVISSTLMRCVSPRWGNATEVYVE
eukprot:1701845-Rhodomonas_salina.1